MSVLVPIQDSHQNKEKRPFHIFHNNNPRGFLRRPVSLPLLRLYYTYDIVTLKRRLFYVPRSSIIGESLLCCPQ